MPGLTIRHPGFGGNLDIENFRIPWRSQVSLGWMQLQFSKAFAEGFVLIAADVLIAKYQYLVSLECHFNLWIIGMGDVAYVHAGTNRATWVEHIEVDPNVRLKVGNNIYELKAVRVETQEEFDALSDVYEVKYGNRPRNENVDEAYLFKLVKRG